MDNTIKEHKSEPESESLTLFSLKTWNLPPPIDRPIEPREKNSLTSNIMLNQQLFVEQF